MKKIVVFLAITFGITWAVEAVLIIRGVSFKGAVPQYAQFVISSVMWAPALGAFLTARIFREKVVPYGWRFGRFLPYAVILVAVPVVFAVAYCLTVLLGLGTLDLGLKGFFASAEKVIGHPLPTTPPPAALIGFIFLLSTLAAPFINSLFGLGEEIGWRGYLLPRLMPLGKVRAYLILGVIWGAWHAPLVAVGFAFPGYPIIGILLFILFTTILGIILNEFALGYKSVILAGWIHGVINSQSYGVWRMIVPDPQPLLGGIPGLIGLLVLALAAGLVLKFFAGREDRERLRHA